MDKIAEVKQTVRHENWKRMYEGECLVCHAGAIGKTFYYRLKVIRKEMLNETDQHDIVPVMQCKTVMPSDMSTTKSDEKIHINGSGIEIDRPRTISAELMTAILRGMQTC